MANNLTASDDALAMGSRPVTPTRLVDELLRPFGQAIKAAQDLANEGCTAAMSDAADQIEQGSSLFGCDQSNEHEAFAVAYANLLRYLAKKSDERGADQFRSEPGMGQRGVL